MEAKRTPLLVPAMPRARLPARAREIASSNWALGVLVFALTWGGGMIEAQTPSIDQSFFAGYNMAAVQGLHFGTDIVLTYGPLGFLKTYLLFYEWPARLAALYGIALHLALSVSVLWAVRRNFGLAIGVAVALVAALLMRGDESAVGIRDDASVIVLALIWCVAAVGRDAPDWARRIVLYGGGPFAALELLTKLNTGLIVVALVVIATIAMDDSRRRNLAILAGTFLTTATALWFAAGQGIGDVVPYLRGSWDIVSGYSSGARIEWNPNQRDYDYFLAPALVLGAGGLAWISARDLPPRRRVAVLAMVAMVSFTAGKGGFVAHDYYHMATLYGTMLGVLIALPLPPMPRLRLGAFAALAAAAVGGFSTHVPGYPLTNPLENLRNGAATVARLVDGGRLADDIAENRATLTANYDLDPRSLELLRGHSVHIEPSEAAAAWAYRLDWEPLPVFQPYAAWTPDLDDRNADALASSDGPERILRQDLNALGRYPAFESPAAMVAMLCNFRAARTTPDWQVLTRTDDRCGEAQPLGSAEGSYGEPIAIPSAPAGSVVVGRVHGIQDSGLDRLRTALVRSRGRQVVFEGDPTLYTFIPTTAADGLILRAPPKLDFPRPFALAPNAPSMTFLLNGGPAQRSITVDFYSLPVAPATS